MITTDPQNEQLTETDSSNKIIGPISRKIAHNSPEKYYRTIYILVFNDRNEILLQKRSSTKDLYPDCWDLSVGGHVDYNSTYEATAIKELEEELGIKTTNEKLILLGEVLVKLPQSNEFFNVYKYQLETDDKLKLSNEEISGIRWMSLADIKDSMRNSTLKWYPRPLQVINSLEESKGL